MISLLVVFEDNDGREQNLFKNNLTYLFLTVLSLCCCMGLLRLQGAGATLQLWCTGFPSWVASLQSVAQASSQELQHIDLCSCGPGSRVQAQQL